LYDSERGARAFLLRNKTFVHLVVSLCVPLNAVSNTFYHGLQSQLRIGGWHGLSATASYTYSHTIDNASEIFSTISGGNTLSFAQNPFNTDRAERANSGIDFPHLVGVTVVYELPFQKAQRGLLGHVLGGWQFNTAYRYASGQPYTTIQNHNSSLCDPTNTLSGLYDACRPIVANAAAPLNSAGVCTDFTLADCGIVDFVTNLPTTMDSVHWILNDNQAAAFFGTPFAGTPRNTLRGQPISTTNLSIYKNTKIGEKMTLQFQATAFNIMNTQFRGVPDPVLDDSAAATPSPFQSTAYNFNGGGNNFQGGGTFSSNLTYDGIGRRRLMFGLKLIF
jgi:hypothetical protein